MRPIVFAFVAGSLLLGACSAQAGVEQTIPTAPAAAVETETSAGLPRDPARGQPGDSITSVPPPTPSEGWGEEPPVASVVRGDGEKFSGAMGTYCWTHGCIDFVAPVSNVEPIRLTPEVRIELEYDGPSAATHSIRWFDVIEAPARPSDRDWLLWQRGTYDREVVAEGTTTPSAPGLCLVRVFSEWNRDPWGDASYGFFVEVLP